MRYRPCRYMGGLLGFNEMQALLVYVREIERENNIIHMYCFIVLRVLLLNIT